MIMKTSQPFILAVVVWVVGGRDYGRMCVTTVGRDCAGFDGFAVAVVDVRNSGIWVQEVRALVIARRVKVAPSAVCAAMSICWCS
jgi:hypothetical protein